MATPDQQEPLQTQPATAAKEFSFAVLGQSPSDSSDIDLQAQARAEIHWTARKACAVLKVTSSIMSAVIVHPGGDSDDATLAEATSELMTRAALLTDAAIGVLGVNPETRNFAGYKNLLRQQAAEVVSTQWRMEHATGAKPLSVEQITDLYKNLLAANPFAGDGEVLPYPSDIDSVTAKRVSLMAVVPELYQAINSFDYFAPEPQSLVEKAMKQVMQAAEQGVSRLVGAKAGNDAVNMVVQSLIGKTGGLYAANYRAMARKDVMTLRSMDAVERARRIYENRITGLPTSHIDESFQRLSMKMIDMVCEAVPEIETASPLIKKTNKQQTNGHASGSDGQEIHQPE